MCPDKAPSCYDRLTPVREQPRKPWSYGDGSGAVDTDVERVVSRIETRAQDVCSSSPQSRRIEIEDTFDFLGTPGEFVEVFRMYYGPAMNAFEEAQRNSRADELRREFEALFTSQNTGSSAA
jgi:hypothetical protein